MSQFILEKLKNELPEHLSYHSIDHTNDVIRAAGEIAVKEGIDEYNKQLLLTAALFHDSGFLNTRVDHETESCNIARRYLPVNNYKPAEIELICSMIMATKMPQSPQTKLEQILCDADLDYLGRDDFFKLGNRLFSELCAEGMIEHEDQWNRHQADFMEGHKYWTQTSLMSRQIKKEQYIKLIKSKI